LIFLKFRFSKKATKFETISHLIWHLLSKTKSKLLFDSLHLLDSLDFSFNPPNYTFTSTLVLETYRRRLYRMFTEQSMFAIIVSKMWCPPTSYAPVSSVWADGAPHFRHYDCEHTLLCKHSIQPSPICF
jgi:hypothetical protein